MALVIPSPPPRYNLKENDTPKTFLDHLKVAATTTLHHAKKHIGMGLICSVAYFDPGNWGVDLQAGSEFGYRLLFVVLLAGIFAVFLQVLASRLGTVTGLDLASHNRMLLYNRPKYTLLYRYLGLYPLYVLAEVAIVATDLAELLGSAIALCMLFPSLELWHGVLITTFDVILILALGDPLRGKPVRGFEILIGAMVLAVLVCMVIIITKVNVQWGDAFIGYLPSKHIFAKGGVYTSVGILGATVMPHSLFLGSALATQDRVSFYDRNGDKANMDKALSISTTRSTAFGLLGTLLTRSFKSAKTSILNAFRTPTDQPKPTKYSERSNNCYEFVKAHIYHGTFDIAGSLLGFAVMINSLILMLAAAVFYGKRGDDAAPASLFDAYDLIHEMVGKGAATIFAIALLSAGQSSSIVATVAGQAVCEGFLDWRVSPIVRRLLTRLLALIPSMVVAIAVGRSGIDALLVGSQVVLSICLPFVTLPLLLCTSSKAIMTVKRTNGDANADLDSSSKSGTEKKTTGDVDLRDTASSLNVDVETEGTSGRSADTVDYSNNKLVIGIGAAIWLLIVAANVYVLVELGMNA